MKVRLRVRVNFRFRLKYIVGVLKLNVKNLALENKRVEKLRTDQFMIKNLRARLLRLEI